MCGIVGVWGAGWARAGDLHREAEAMAWALRHRGPDGAGVFVDAPAGLALGHRRLSVIDLSASGAQPMSDPAGRYTLSFNGEIYNYRELRRRLAPERPFRGSSDTEVLLAAVERWGVREAVPRLEGMFAFAVWDREERRLWLVRDRLGIKPLYLARSPHGFAFASDLAGLRALSGFEERIDRRAFAAYLERGYVPAPLSIFEGVEKLEPGCILRLDGPTEAPSVERFWSAADVVSGARAHLERDPARALSRLEETLRSVVAERLVSDVPLGAFLSGGVDSSLVTAMMCLESSARVRTFSIGFEEGGYDEAVHARAVAEHLGTDHTELCVTAAQARAVIPRLAGIYTEPFADSSQIPTLLVSELARREVTVVLSGDGGDELFGGYNRHLWAPRVLGWNRRLPHSTRAAVARLLLAHPTEGWDAVAARAERFLPSALRVRLAGQKVHKLAGLLGADDPDALYARVTSLWPPGGLPLESGLEAPRWPERTTPPGLGFAEAMMFRDLVGYLPDDILTKVDRASMSVGLEARVPLIDRRVVELAWSLAPELKIRGGKGKWILRELLHRSVPAALVERPKMGFAIPLAEWLRGPLRAWVDELLEPRALEADGLLDAGRVRALWGAHLRGERSHPEALWAVLMFQSWRAHGRAEPGPPR